MEGASRSLDETRVSKTLKAVIICSFSVLLLFPDFFSNYWHVANQQWFDDFQHDSQSLVIGRLVMSRQGGIFSSGGLTGQGSIDATPPPSISTNGISDPITVSNQYRAYANNLSFEAYTTYNSQIGGQAIVLGILEKSMTGSPQEKLRLYHLLSSLLSAIALAAVILWFYLEFGLIVGLFVLGSAVCSQWLVVFGRNLWWSTWSFYVPLAVVMHYLGSHRELTSVKSSMLGVAVFVSVFVKCLFSGYEYITTTLIMLIVPLVYYGILKEWSFRKFLNGLFTAAFSSFLAVLLTFVILCLQIGSVEGSFQAGIHHIVYSFQKRTYANPQELPARFAAGLESNPILVLANYLRGSFFDANNYLYCSNHFVHVYLLKLHYLYLLLLFGLMSGILCFFKNGSLPKKEKRKRFALVCATWFSILAPLSWFIIFKAHSYVHTHLNFIVWQMPFTFFGFAVCGWVVKSLLSNLPHPWRNDSVAERTVNHEPAGRD